MDIHFACTQCGKCCHDLRLPLSFDEAMAWAGDGHTVQILTEALAIADDAVAASDQVQFDIDRSFPVLCGQMPMRVAVQLVAWYTGACPYLQPDMRCGQYAQRPRICRIYPADRRPFAIFDRNRKLCPPEAWADDQPLLIAGDAIVDADDAQALRGHRQAWTTDAPALQALCATLGIARAAFANEGLAVFTPDPAQLLSAAMAARHNPATPATAPWTIVTNRRATLTMLADAGCEAMICASGADYLGSFADEL